MSFPDLLAAPDWRPVVVALFGILLIALIWTSFRSQAPLWVKIAGSMFKAAGVFLLGLCLLEPMETTEVPKTGANLLVLMADASQSLQVRDAGAKLTREETLRNAIDKNQSWLEQLGRTFELRKFEFARQVESTDFESYQAEGIGTSILTSLDSVARRYRDQSVAGILIFTDGNATDVGDLTSNLQDLPPVFPVVVGKSKPKSDISIARFSVSQTNFEAAPVNIAAELETSGFQGSEIKAQLLDESGAVVQEQTVSQRDSDGMAALRFKVRPENPGVSVYRLRVAEASQFVAFDDPEASLEATMLNNERTILVNRARGPYRILYVSGRPNWEFKFLRRAMLADDEVDLVGLIRIAREEPKFTFRGHRDESTNSLYRGFGNEEDEDAERYNEPVLVRIGTRDAEELRGGFPTSADELFQYEAVILDDLEAAYFTEDQKTLLHQFVTTRGGGLLMLGGQESFVEGGYDRTPIGELLPIYLDQTETTLSGSGYQMELTREGWLQPWIRMEATEHEEQERLDAMPAFTTINQTRSIKPGASVLARVSDNEGRSHNALVSQRMGNGRAAALLIGDFWKWHFRGGEGNGDMLKAWRQMLRWLISDVPGQVEIDIQSQNDANLSVNLRISVVDQSYVATENAEVDIVITRPDGTTVKLNAVALDEAAGTYGATFVPRQPGPYRVSAEATSSDGAEIGKGRNGWVSEPANAEFQVLTPNRALLEEIAAKTGGELIELDDIQKLANKLPVSSAPVMETRLNPWWHNSWLFLLALGLLVSEWGLRRWKGLP